MFDSMQTRMAVWHTGLVATLLILFALTTYNYVYRATSRKTTDSLIESVNSFTANITTELAEGDQSPTEAIQEVTNGIHLADRQFAVFDSNLKLVAISARPSNVQPNNSSPPWPP